MNMAGERARRAILPLRSGAAFFLHSADTFIAIGGSALLMGRDGGSVGLEVN